MNGLLLLFADLVIRSTLLVLLAWGVTGILRRCGGSAAMRHLVWLGAISGLLLLPLIAVTMPDLPIAVLPEAAAQPTALTATGVATGDLPQAGQPPSTPTDVIMTVYLAIAAGMLAMLLSAHRTLLAIWQSASPAGSEWSEPLSSAAADLRLRQSVELRLAPGSVMPMTWGTRLPKILLPAEAEDWTLARRRFVLLHEIAHVRRRDSLTQAAAVIVRALYWFHPGAWFAAQQLQLEQELAADDLALGAGAQADAYARNLLELACAFCLPAPAMARRSQLEQRLTAIIRPARRRAPGMGFGAAALSLILAATWLSATVTPVARAAPARAAMAAPPPPRAMAAVAVTPAAPRLAPVPQGEDAQPARLASPGPVAPVAAVVAMAPHATVAPVAPVAPAVATAPDRTAKYEQELARYRLEKAAHREQLRQYRLQREAYRQQVQRYRHELAEHRRLQDAARALPVDDPGRHIPPAPVAPVAPVAPTAPVVPPVPPDLNHR
jgi:beta-lactamase regulating signal transducer with metallopeptidase domain